MVETIHKDETGVQRRQRRPALPREEKLVLADSLVEIGPLPNPGWGKVRWVRGDLISVRPWDQRKGGYVTAIILSRSGVTVYAYGDEDHNGG